MKRFLFLLSLFPALLSAQKSSFQRSYTGSSEKEVMAWLERSIPALQHKETGLKALSITESPGGKHFLFQQCYRGFPVYGAQVKLNTDKQGRSSSLFDNTLPVTELSSLDFPGDKIAYGRNFLSKLRYLPESIETERVIFRSGEEFLPVLKVEVRGKGSQYQEFILDAHGTLLSTRDLNCYHHALQDSLVGCMIFSPDPLTSANVSYGSPYVDSSDFDVPQLNLQRSNVTMKVDFSNDTFRLKGPFAIVKEFDNPVTTPAFCKTNANFNYTRNQQEFEDVNAFYYVTMFHDYIQSLGFSNIVNYQIWIDAHAMGGADNSMFSPGFTPARLLFGEGGVDDAEDADVILHEYGHAMSYSAAPNTNSGTQRQTLDEANSDYFAASYSRSINSFSWGNVYSWDGHNPFWPGRVVVSSKQYPSSLVNNIYTDAEIWSATIMEIWGDIGRQTTDKILLESMYSYASGMNMPAAAQLFIKADSSLNNGANYTAICNRFKNRGILSSCPTAINEPGNNGGILLINSAGFSRGEILHLILPNGTGADITLSDALGRVVMSLPAKSGDVELSPENLAAGCYVLSVHSGSETYRFKLLRH